PPTPFTSSSPPPAPTQISTLSLHDALPIYNLVISLLAKQEFAVPRVVARVNHPKNEWLFNENWGVDVAVSTPHLILALTEEALSDRKSTRLNSSHGSISYAVFCLKKKKNT